MSHECPMCGQWVESNNDLTPEQDKVVSDYVAHLAEKSKERKGKELADALAREAALQERCAKLKTALEKLEKLVEFHWTDPQMHNRCDETCPVFAARLALREDES